MTLIEFRPGEGSGRRDLSLESRVKFPYIHESRNFLEPLLVAMMYNSRIMGLCDLFSWFTLYIPVNSRITETPSSLEQGVVYEIPRMRQITYRRNRELDQRHERIIEQDWDIRLARVQASTVSKYFAPTKGLRSKRHAAFQNSQRRLIYPYQLHVDN